MKYYLHLISLKNCPFSIKAENLLQKYKPQITKIDFNEKEKWKNKQISTFPQIYLKKNNSQGSLLLGGYDDIKGIIDIIANSKGKKIHDTKEKLNRYYPKISEKTILRIIELFI